MNIYFKTTQNDGKSNTVLQYVTEVCRPIFGCNEVQTRTTCDVYRKTCFCLKILRNGLNMNLSRQALVKNIVYGMEKPDAPAQKKFRAQ